MPRQALWLRTVLSQIWTLCWGHIDYVWRPAESKSKGDNI